MQYFIKRNEKANGPFSESQVKSGIQEGKLKETDLISNSKEGPWRPLKQALKIAIDSMPLHVDSNEAPEIKVPDSQGPPIANETIGTGQPAGFPKIDEQNKTVTRRTTEKPKTMFDVWWSSLLRSFPQKKYFQFFFKTPLRTVVTCGFLLLILIAVANDELSGDGAKRRELERQMRQMDEEIVVKNEAEKKARKESRVGSWHDPIWGSLAITRESGNAYKLWVGTGSVELIKSGSRYYMANRPSDYFEINGKGNLESWDDSGLIYEAQKR